MRALRLVIGVVVFVFASCGVPVAEVDDGGASSLDAGSTRDAGGTDAGRGSPDAGPPGLDAGLPEVDAGPPAVDAGLPEVDAGLPDGTAQTRACTNAFGNGLTATHGRLDGLLVAIVHPGASSCNGDSDHVHLQVLVGSSVYDVAVNVHDNTGGDVLYLARDGLPEAFTWAEGWHPNQPLGYRTLGLTAGAFTAEPLATLAQHVEAELATVNHISVFATGYGPTGAHEVHYRDGTSLDGAIVTRPLSGNSRTLYFHFANQSF